MPQLRDWTVAEVGELVAGVQLLRTPIAGALNRQPQEVEEKIADLGLAQREPARPVLRPQVKNDV